MTRLLRRLYSFLFRTLKTAGLVDERWIKAKAFDLIQERLFRLPWVKAVGVLGFSRMTTGGLPPSEVRIIVLTNVARVFELQEQVDAIVVGVNDQLGTKMKSLVLDQRGWLIESKEGFADHVR